METEDDGGALVPGLLLVAVGGALLYMGLDLLTGGALTAFAGSVLAARRGQLEGGEGVSSDPPA